MERFLNALKVHAHTLDQTQSRPRFATVASVDTGAATVRVMLQPENVLSGWLPVLSSWTGAGWGMVCLPSPGDQVFVVGQENDADNGVVIGSAFSSKRMPPKAPAGEFWLVHAKGTSLRLTNDGCVRIIGDLHVSGDVFDAHGPLSRLRTIYDEHTHFDSRGGLTAMPNQQD